MTTNSNTNQILTSNPNSANIHTNNDLFMDKLTSAKLDKEKLGQMINSIYCDDSNYKLFRTPSIQRNPSLTYTSFKSPIINLSRSSSILSQSSSSTIVNSNTNLNKDHLDSKVDLVGSLPSARFISYDHATWYVSNAKQSAAYFVTCFGFKHVAYRGLETGSKLVASHVVQNGNVLFEFVSPITVKSYDPHEMKYLNSIFDFVRRHGDGVKDVAFTVDNVDAVYKHAIKSGAKSVSKPRTMRDSFGSVRSATIEVFDDIYHTLIQREDYKGVFLPGYKAVQGNALYDLVDAVSIKSLPQIRLDKIDHCVQNEDWNKLESACDVYSRVFGFHRFWSVDEQDISTEYSALRSIVMASANEEIKMPMNEPADGICKSQIEEFLEFYNGPGVQHIAVLTDDIIQSVSNMKARGAEFIKVPKLYYENLLPRLLATGVHIFENLDDLKRLGILIDFDERGYLLQIFTKPLTDRPTFFLEIIQRHNHDGFGKGNFKSLFETIEAEQRLRGTLEK